MPEIADIKIAVLKCALGISSLEEKDLYERLETFWAQAFADGCKETGEAIIKLLVRESLMTPAAATAAREKLGALWPAQGKKSESDK